MNISGEIGDVGDTTNTDCVDKAIFVGNADAFKDENNVAKVDEKDGGGGGEIKKTHVMAITKPLAIHPLENTWNLWYLKLERARLWEDQLMSVNQVKTVQEFWSLFKYIQPPSQLPMGSDYFFFKHKIKPMWEDSSNCKGGRWLINIGRHQRAVDLDWMWLELLLLLVGEGLEQFSPHVCGACVNIRAKGDKIGVWTRNCKDVGVIESIGKRIRERLNIPSEVRIGYQAHVDTIKEGTAASNRFIM